jgi:putative heme degradation protein
MPEHESLRQQIIESPPSVFSRLPLIGKLMIVVRNGGATHERIGSVESLDRTGDVIFIKGQAHDFTMDARFISSIVIDRSGRMKDKVLPRIEFGDAVGDLAFSIVALDGVNKFDYAFAYLKSRAVAPPAQESLNPPSPSVEDIGLRPLNAARAEESEIAIEMHRPGAIQRWCGVVREINMAMGFINIITPDFHLHLRSGAVFSWQQREIDGNDKLELTAMDEAGQAFGLVLRGTRKDFGLS